MHARHGFTLVEISIVIVIIGLILGGILVGRDLIRMYELRGVITQIEKYRAAVYTFRTKYNCIPGDCRQAAAFGFPAGGSLPGQRDGNGLIQGPDLSSFPIAAVGTLAVYGEAGVFWTDLSRAQLIEHTFNTTLTSTATSGVYYDAKDFLPPAKTLDRNNYIYVNSGVYPTSKNHFSVSTVTGIYPNSMGSPQTPDIDGLPGLTAEEAYFIDSKADDGLPQYGSITAQYLNVSNYNYWAASSGSMGGAHTLVGFEAVPTTAATPALQETCYHNNNVAGAPQRYASHNYDEFELPNCALSFAW